MHLSCNTNIKDTDYVACYTVNICESTANVTI